MTQANICLCGKLRIYLLESQVQERKKKVDGDVDGYSVCSCSLIIVKCGFSNTYYYILAQGFTENLHYLRKKKLWSKSLKFGYIYTLKLG